MPDARSPRPRISKRFGGLLALAGVDFAIAAGEIFGVIGPNGAGKTTLFSCLVGALAPTSGEIRFRGERIDGLPNWPSSRADSCGRTRSCGRSAR